MGRLQWCGHLQTHRTGVLGRDANLDANGGCPRRGMSLICTFDGSGVRYPMTGIGFSEKLSRFHAGDSGMSDHRPGPRPNAIDR